MKITLLRVFAAREVCLVQGGVSSEADAGAGAALFLVPEIAPLLHAGADVGEGADGGVVGSHAISPGVRKQELSKKWRS